MDLKHVYRGDARNALRRAQAELASNDDSRLRYAALELRVAMECLAYERLLLYEDEVPSSSFDTWQPRHVMDLLLELDPKADSSSSIAIAPESAPGVTSGPFKVLGSESVQSMKDIKEYYAKLGSHLHAQTVSQARAGKTLAPGSMRAHCNEVAEVITKVLSSRVFNINIKLTGRIECMRCKHPIVRRFPPSFTSLETSCPACQAPYVLHDRGNNQVEWQAKREKVSCAGPACDESLFIWQDHIKPGVYWTCARCRGQNSLRLVVAFVAPAPSSAEGTKEEPGSTEAASEPGT